MLGFVAGSRAWARLYRFGGRHAAKRYTGGPVAACCPTMSDLLSRTHAIALDAADPLRPMRNEFLIPRHGGGEQTFVGNSLGLQPRGAQAAVQEVMKQWGELAEGHFTGPTQWLSYHRLVSAQLARVVGALPSVVVAMNTLSVNLHLMMVSFYRPTTQRPVILMEAGAFPTDRHAVEAQIRFHGFDPAECLVEVQPDEANGTISLAAIERAIAEHGPRLALVLWLRRAVPHRPGLRPRIPAPHACRGRASVSTWRTGTCRCACIGAGLCGWCHYKYLNSGPGALPAPSCTSATIATPPVPIRRLVGP